MTRRHKFNASKGDIRNNRTEIKAPDGGWGWMVVVAYGCANIMIVPVLQSFGLIFKDKFNELGMSATDSSLILNLNSALGMTLGLFNGVLLRKFGYRKVALLGGSLYSSGLIATSWANSFTHFLITYSIISSIGMGMCTSSFSLALNTYFKENRNKASGIGMTITGLGPIVLPQLAYLLLEIYGAQGCILIIGSVSLHIISAALLLQPVKWHQIRPEVRRFKLIRFHIDESNVRKTAFANNGGLGLHQTPSWDKISEDENDYLERCPIYHERDIQNIYGFDISTQPIRQSEEYIWKDLNYKFQPKETVKRARSFQHFRQRFDAMELLERHAKSQSLLHVHIQDDRRWFESGSASSVHLGSSMKIFEEKQHHRVRLAENFRNLGRRLSTMAFDPARRMSLSNFGRRRSTVVAIPEDDLPPIAKQESLTNIDEDAESEEVDLNPKPGPCDRPIQCMKDGWYRFVKVFDLGLLNDVVYLNMMVGIAIAVFAEINFSLLTPFFLSDFGYNTQQIAMFMSTVAVVDIGCRFASPFIGDYFKQPPRIMYMYSLLMLIITRTCLLLVNSYQGILIVAAGLGVAKGVRSVYMSLVVPNYIPLERLPAASGIQMVTNGVLLLSMGSLVGAFRDLTGSYSICIIYINFITFTTLVLWSAEMYYMRRKRATEIEEEPPRIDLDEVKKMKIMVNAS